MYKITDNCVSCEVCIPECAEGAIARGDDQCQIAAEKCTSCAKCVAVCPISAIIAA